ncbi:MAG: hypothetical protein AB8H12_02085 [Lewinella sp.]
MQYPISHTDAGAKSALTDEYARAIAELKAVIHGISDEALCEIVDFETKDEDCRSIQTILTHVIRAGYGYAIAVRKWKGEVLDYRSRHEVAVSRILCGLAKPDIKFVCRLRGFYNLRATA